MLSARPWLVAQLAKIRTRYAAACVCSIPTVASLLVPITIIIPTPTHIHNQQTNSQVLGIPKNADYNAIQRAYRKKMSEAITDEAEKSRIEAAHSSLMMSALTSRLQGNTSVDKNVLYADRARYFPWRPRIFLAERQVILYAGISQAVLLAWALLSPLTAGTQPVVWCTFFSCFSFFSYTQIDTFTHPTPTLSTAAIAGAVANVYKQNRINPPPARGMELSEEERKQGGKNIIRGAFLAFLATFGGCFALYTAPDAVAAAVNKVLPLWFYEGQTMLLAIGSCLFNWIFTSAFR